MRKILFIVFAFMGLSISAQEKLDPKEAMKIAEQQSTEILKKSAEFLQIEDRETFNKISEVVKTKFMTMAQYPDLSDRRKELLTEQVIVTLEELLTKEQLQKLESESEIYSRLVK